MMRKSTADWLVVFLACAAGTLLGCGSSGSRNASPGPSPGQNSATLTLTISPQVADVRINDTAQFTAEVTGSDNHGVTWRIQEPLGGNVDGTGKYTAPGTSGYFHVVAISAADPNVTASAAVMVHSTAAPVRYIGVNLMWQAPWDETQLFSDIMTQVNWFEATLGAAPDWWPTTGSFTLTGIGASANNFGSRPFHDGRYRIKFRGQANISPRSYHTYYLANTTTPYSAAAAYDPATNTTQLDAVVTHAAGADDSIGINVKDADRNGWPGGLAANSRKDGLTDIHMYRPGTYDPATGQITNHFNPQFITATQQFSLLRPMQTQGPAPDQYNGGMSGVMASKDVNWSDRALPGMAYERDGVPYEELVLMANLLGKDVWVCIPLHASDDYIRKVAQTFAFGSDRATGLPFTGPYGSTYDATNNPRPATHDPTTWTLGNTDWYPPLDRARTIYLEYSNEIWNYNNTTNNSIAQADVTAGDPWKIAWDGQTDAGIRGHRRVMAKIMQIGLEFRRVFGDTVCNAAGKEPTQVKIRPVFAYQAYGVRSVTQIAGTANWIEAARDYFDHVWGASSTEQMIGPTGFQFSNRPSGSVQTDPYYLWGASSGGYLDYYDGAGHAISVDDALDKTRRSWEGLNMDGTGSGIEDIAARGWGNAPYKYSMTAEHDWWAQRGIRFNIYEGNHGFSPGYNSYEGTAAEDSRLATILQAMGEYLYSLPDFDAYVLFSLTQNNLWSVKPTLYSTGYYVGNTWTTALAE